MMEKETISDYRKVRQELEYLGVEYKTFQLKENRPFRVVIRNLHSTRQKEIIEELKIIKHETPKLP